MALETLVQALTRLAVAGYGDDLVADGDGLRVVSTGERLAVDEVVVTEIVRFEGETNPDDEAILFAVATVDGRPLGTYTAPYGPDAGGDDVDVVVALTRVADSDESLAAHTAHDHVVAVFDAHGDVEAAVGELRRRGFGSEHLGLAVHEGDRYVFERDVEEELGRDTLRGVATGIPVGALAGMLVAALALPGIGTLGVGGVLALAWGSGFGGAMIGGYLGAARDSTAFDEHEHLGDVALQPGQVLVAVCSHGEPEEVADVLRRHSGRVLGPR